MALHDNRPNPLTYHQTIEFLIGDNQPAQVYCFPPEVLHGYRCMNGPAHVIYVTSGVYDLSDEIRIPYDDFTRLGMTG